MSAGRWWWATSFALVALFVALRFWDPALAGGPDLCLFHHATGFACPACGLTRATAALAKGRFAEALRWHPLAALIVGEGLAGWLLWGAALAGRRRAAKVLALVPEIALGNGLLLLVVWIVRWTCGALPA